MKNQNNKKKWKNLFTNKRAQAAIATAVKVVTSLVLGGSVLVGTYGVVNSVVVPTTQAKVSSIAEYSGDGSGGAGSGSGGVAFPSVDPALNPAGTIPTGATYVTGYEVSGTNFVTSAGGLTTYSSGDRFPETISDGDMFTYGSYVYRYNAAVGYTPALGIGALYMQYTIYSNCNGWTCYVPGDRDTGNPFSETSYGDIMESINGTPIVSLNNAFAHCSNLINAPTIPSGVKNLNNTFSGCVSLVSAPVIPNGVTTMRSAFSGCTALTTPPTIPDTVTDMGFTFAGCTITVAPAIPSHVTMMESTFSGCTSLVTAPVIPASVTVMNYTFKNCTSLKGTIEVNAVPESYASCFDGCAKTSDAAITLTGTSTATVKNALKASGYNNGQYISVDNTRSTLENGDTYENEDYQFTFYNDQWTVSAVLREKETYSDIPKTIKGKPVTSMDGLFCGNSVIKTAPAIPNTIVSMSGAFAGCVNLTTAPTIPSSVLYMEGTFGDCSSLSGIVEVNANPEAYDYCFGGTSITGISGSTTMKSELLATK